MNAIPEARLNAPAGRSLASLGISHKTSDGLGMTPSQWLRGVTADAGGAGLTSAMQQSAWVYSCVNLIAENLANTNFRFTGKQGAGNGERGTESPTEFRAPHSALRVGAFRAPHSALRVGAFRAPSSALSVLESGPLIDLFAQPHPETNSFDFWTLVVYWLQLRGRCHIVLTDDDLKVLPITMRLRGDALPTRMIVLPEDRISRILRGRRLVSWLYTPNLSDPLDGIELYPDQVLFLRLPNPYDWRDGLSPLDVAMLAARTDFAAGQVMKGLALNNADTGLIVETDQVIPDETRKQIEAGLRERKRTAGTADRPLILEAGLKVTKPTLSMVDLQFLENRKYSRQEICAIYRVPQELLGFTEDANRSVGDAARLNFTEHTLAPLAIRLAAGLQPIVRIFGDSLTGWFDIDNLPVMQAARRARVDTAAKFFAMGWSAGDINVALDLGMPEFADDQRHYLPFNLQEVGAKEELPADQLPKEEAEKGRTGETVNPFVSLANTLRSLTSSPVPPVSHSPIHQCLGSAEYEASIKWSFRKKRTVLGRFFFEQRGRALKALAEKHGHRASGERGTGSGAPLSAERGTRNGEPLSAERGTGNGEPNRRQNSALRVPSSALESSALRTLHSALEGSALRVPSSALKSSQLLDFPSEDAELIKRLKPALLSDLNFGGAQLWEEIGAAGDFEVRPEEALAYLAKRQSAIRDINRTTDDALKETLAEGIAAGQSYEQLAMRVKEIFKEASDSRADTIALTETNSAVNTGRDMGMHDAGVEYHAWLSANLATSREAHVQAGVDYADGIPLDEPFIVDDEELQYPGDPDGSPGNTINCKCVVIAVAAPSPGGEGGGEGERAVGPRCAAVPNGDMQQRVHHFLSFEDWLGRAAAAGRQNPPSPQ